MATPNKRLNDWRGLYMLVAGIWLAAGLLGCLIVTVVYFLGPSALTLRAELGLFVVFGFFAVCGGLLLRDLRQR